MSLISDRHECPNCGGYDGWLGDRYRRDPDRSRLACKCPEPPSEPALSVEETAPIERRFRERGSFFL